MSNYQHKKNLGQNWLVDLTVADDMITTVDFSDTNTVIEVGPGEGALTHKLLDVGAKVIAIEKDRDLHELLEQKFSAYNDQFQLIKADIRDINLENVVQSNSYHVIANIPYYLTGLIIRLFLESATQPKSMTLLMQREVVDRIIANDDKESVLSLSVKAYGHPIKIRNVKAGAFRPIPSVDSAVLHISNISRDWFRANQLDETRFFKTIKQAFNQKRKTLRSSLSNFKLGQYSTDRPEDLSLDDWAVILHQ